MHTITKSQVVGKTIQDLPISIRTLTQTGGRHEAWTTTYTGVIDFLSRCTLRYANSYGATYKIDPTCELRIISNKGNPYIVSSYVKLFELVIEDYQEFKPQPTKSISTEITKLQPGDKVRVRSDLTSNTYYSMLLTEEKEVVSPEMVKLKGQIVTITKNEKGKYRIKEDKGDWRWTDEMFSEIITTTEEQPITDYKIDKSKLKPGTVVHCDTFEKAVAITSLIENSITISQYNNYRNQTDIYIDTMTSWSYADISFRETNEEEYTIVPFENLLVKPIRKFKVGDMVKLKDDLKSGYIYNNTTFYSQHTFTGAKLITEIHTTSVDVQVGNWWYGVDALELVPTSLEERITKQLEEQVAQSESIKSIKKEESFMSKLKATAIATIDQNKEAAIIATKMEAGRIINKQVLKQLTPHLPFFLQGYAKSPFAPFVAANLVAMVANHTGNSKLTKVSDLMLLGAADSGVAVFNLDKIVDDILSNIKLPAGILDDSEE